MDSSMIAKELKKLDQLEIDGSILIDRAVDKLKDSTIQTELIEMNMECADNIAQLEEMIRALGEEPPKHTSDTKGIIMQGYTALRGMVGDQGIIEALDTTLKPIVKAYESFLANDISPEIKDKVSAIFEVVKKHAEHINLRTRCL